jgi:hypothetical protein
MPHDASLSTMSKGLTVMKFHGYVGAAMLASAIGVPLAVFVLGSQPAGITFYLVLLLLTVVNTLFTAGMLLLLPFRLLSAERKGMPRGWWLGIVTAFLSIPAVGFLGFFVGRT